MAFFLDVCPGTVEMISSSYHQVLVRGGIWKLYSDAVQQDPSINEVSYSTFCHLWKLQLPHLILMKPMTDLCWVCQKNNTAILRAANCPDKEKTEAFVQSEEYIRIVQTERSYYKTCCKTCKDEVTAHFTISNDFQPPPPASQSPANSRDIKVHYSFDYAQQIHYPSDAMQPGPIYFLTPRKCALLGVNCESVPHQIYFLCDEAGYCGKGTNTVLSQLDYFFNHHGLGEKEVFLHADNFSGQNKNNTMLQYLAWHVLTGRHTQITLSFLVIGHTKFAPNWCFGLFKRLCRRTKLGSLKAIAQVTIDSAKCNFPELGINEDCTIVVPTYNWADLFASKFRRFVGIKKYQHFRFVYSEPGVVFARNHCDTPEERVELLKGPWLLPPTQLPTRVFPKGLSPERQWYLFELIRQFCSEECPKPDLPKPTSRAGMPANDDGSSNPLSTQVGNDCTPTQRKKSRVCGTCRRDGHNNRTCPDKNN